jgi:outer membrane immunogenic protein
MRHLAFSVVASFASISLITIASAADIPRAPVYKAPAFVPAAPVFSWTGFYIGAHGGWGWARWSGEGTTANGDGWLAGVQLGYNYQFGNYVAGIEGDYSFADVKKTADLFAGSITQKNDYFATIAGRLGWAFDRTLLYGKGGVAFTRDKLKGNDGLGGTVTGDWDRVGWMIGAGVEYAMWNNVSVKLEYNFLDFGSKHEAPTTTGGLAATPADVKEITHLVKLGVNYRF